MNSLSMDIEALFGFATDAIDFFRGNMIGTILDVFVILMAVTLAVMFFWQISSSKEG